MFFKSYILNTVFKNQPLDLSTEEIKNVIASLSTPKNAAVAALSVTTTFILYKLLFTRSSRDKEIPEFPGATVFLGHRSLIEQSTSEGEFARALNPAKLSLGFFSGGFHEDIVSVWFESLERSLLDQWNGFKWQDAWIHSSHGRAFQACYWILNREAGLWKN